MYRLLACLLLFIWLSNSLLMGQSLQYRFEHITVNEGLSHSDAMTIIQDHKGFLWIGTNKGIDQYDGYRLKKYTLPREQTGTTFSNRIRSLRIGADGRLWAGGEGMSLYYYDASTDQFRKVKPGPKIDSDRYKLLTDIRTLAIDKRGTVWVGTRQGGVLAVRVDQSGVIETLEQIRIPNQAGNWSIEKLALDTQGRLWIGALGGGLWHYTIPSRLVSAQAEPFSILPMANVRGLYLDQQANLWFADDTRVYWLNLADKTQQPHVIAGSFDGIGSLYRDSFGQLWVGTNRGLHCFKLAAASKHTPPVPQGSGETFLPEDANEHSINSSRIHEIYEDRFHNIWLAASAGGINKLNLRSKPFHHLHRLASQSPTLSNNYVNAIISDQDVLWIGTRNGISQYDRFRQTYRNFLSFPANMNGMDVSTLYKASNGSIWAGTRYGGLWKKNPAETGFQPIENPSRDRPWTITSIESITEDPFRTIWVATYNRGLYRYSINGDLLAHYQQQNNSLPTNRLTCLLADGKTLWISTHDNGVLQCQLDQDSLRVQKTYVHDPADAHSLQVNYAWPLQKDTRGNLWIGTIGGGLHQLNLSTGRMQRWLAQVPETDVESILLDEKGHVWVGGEGLYDFDPVSRQVVHYDVTDGLQSNAFKVGAAFRGSDQTMYWGGANGVTFFKPVMLTQNRIAPLVRITGLRIHNQRVGVGDTLNGRILIDKPLDEHPDIEISHAENDFSIEFVGLDYISPSKHQYKYRLVGFNTDWIQTTPGQRLVSFTNLPAGTYRFEVKARNADGVWSQRPAVLVFDILSPWYQSPWAYLLYGGVLLLALLLYRKVALRQQKLKNEVHLREILYEKEKELTDLKLNFFTQVSHELRTPLTLIMGPVEELMQENTVRVTRREQLQLVHRQVQKLNNLVNELLDFRKTESGNAKLQAQRADIITFLKELFVLFSFRAEEQQINYRFESSHSELFMAFDPAKMETVISNLLSNALKFTPAGGTIRLLVNLEQEQHVRIVVEDTGHGIAPDELDRIFDPYYQAHQSGSLQVKGTGIGLALVKSLVALHQGQISVESQPGQGTRFVIALPLHQPEVMDSAPPGFVYEEVLPNELLLNVSTDFRILIVEDDKEVQQYLRQLLSSYTLTVAENGIQALDLLQDQTFDLVLTDVMMPEMNGIELCRKIRQSPKLAYLPIVMLTARSTVVEELEGLSTGADEYIAKPFKPQVLLARLGGLLQARTRLKEYYHRQILLQPSEVIIPNADKEFLAKAMRIVEDHLTDGDFSVQDLLDEIGMSQSVFYRRMKSITGQSVIEFIRDVRMKRAAQLLATSSYRISEIAYMVGVEDPKNFRKSFQRVYQMSPSDYVRQHREGSFTSLDDNP